MNEKHTIEQLQQMSDSELAELTARLRGWTLERKTSDLEDNLYWCEQGEAAYYCADWNPATAISQAYGLLLWLREQRIATYQIHGLTINPGIWIWRLKDETGFAVFGVDARAMCYAFVLAMQEVSND